MTERASKRRTGSQSGMSIFLVALGLTLLLAIVGFSVDLANLYVARNEAQRAADAAALAGAQEFVSGSVTSGLITVTAAAPLAATHASQVGNQNLIIGRNPGLKPTNFNTACPPPTGVSGGCFNFSATNDPRITVVVQKNMPTYFMKIFGIKTVPVSVVATAEAYNPAGADGPTNSVQCLKPWLLPNCDANHPVPAPPTPPPSTCPAGANCYCGQQGTGDPHPGYWSSYFVDPNNSDTIVHPGLKPTGVIGEKLTVKVGLPGDAEAPSKFWPVFLPGNSTFVCPSCASQDQQNSTSNSAALYRENIECCSTEQIACGTTTVSPINGNMVGPTRQGVDCLIHEASNGRGQDCISLDTSPTCSGAQTSLVAPFIMYAGGNNPYGKAEGDQITTSDSLVTLPIYDGSQLCPGSSSAPNCPSTITVNVVGFLQLFIQEVDTQNLGAVYAYVLNVSGCGANGTTSSGDGDTSVVPVYTGSPIPVRLVHN